jgi:hypothetical protein
MAGTTTSATETSGQWLVYPVNDSSERITLDNQRDAMNRAAQLANERHEDFRVEGPSNSNKSFTITPS